MHSDVGCIEMTAQRAILGGSLLMGLCDHFSTQVNGFWTLECYGKVYLRVHYLWTRIGLHQPYDALVEKQAIILLIRLEG